MSHHQSIYRAVQLHFDPKPLADGKYCAQVIIHRTTEGLLETVPLTGETYATEEEAATQGRLLGQAWVDKVN